MRKFTTLLIASAMSLGTVTLAHADQASTSETQVLKTQHHKHGPRHHGSMMLKNLNLTDAQKQQVQDIMKAERQNLPRPSMNERSEMHNLVISDSFDRTKAEALIDKNAAQHKARMLSMLETQHKIYEILTPEQKKQFNDNFTKHMTQPHTKHEAAN